MHIAPLRKTGAARRRREERPADEDRQGKGNGRGTGFAVLSVTLIACRMHLCVMTHANCVPLVIPWTRWGIWHPKWSTHGGHAEGTGTSGAIRWAPCVCDNAARTSGQR